MTKWKQIEYFYVLVTECLFTRETSWITIQQNDSQLVVDSIQDKIDAPKDIIKLVEFHDIRIDDYTRLDYREADALTKNAHEQLLYGFVLEKRKL